MNVMTIVLKNFKKGKRKILNFKVNIKGNETDRFNIKISQQSHEKMLTTFEVKSKINIFGIDCYDLRSNSMELIAKHVTFNEEK